VWTGKHYYDKRREIRNLPLCRGIRNIFGNIQGIFSIWLPASGYKMDERYGMNIYRKMDRDQEYVVMDLCIPVK
jgi:hypothetical protein